MSFTAAAKASLSTKFRDDINAGTLQVVDASGNVLVAVPLDTVAGTVSGAGVITLSGFPKTITASNAGSASPTGGRLRTSAGVLYKTDISVGVPGSGAQIIIDNGVNSLVISAGAAVTFSGAPAPTFTPA